jgi:hypothetical protein
MNCTNRGADDTLPPSASRAPGKASLGYAKGYRVLETA